MNYYLKVLQNYSTFNGRADRKEYWIFFSFNFIFSFGLTIIDRLVSFNNARYGLGFINIFFSIVVFIPSFAVGVRRMHDVGKSGWFLLIPIYNLILACSKSQKGINKYDTEPEMKLKALFLWVFSIIFTMGIAYYQRTTGPTYPLKKSVVINDIKIKCKLPRAYGGEGDAEIKVLVSDTAIKGFLKFKRFKSFDEWSEIPMDREGDHLIAKIPHQPPAGKVSYELYFIDKNVKYTLTETPVIIRFRGDVPAWVLIPHIIFMFGAMLFSTRTGLEALTKGKNTFKFTFITVIALFIGGSILGPVVQKYAFGAYWTGWPFGHDLTDNKTAVALIFWIIALIVMWRKKDNRFWAIFAAFMLLVVYLIPHSVLGSEIDYTKKTETVNLPLK